MDSPPVTYLPPLIVHHYSCRSDDEVVLAAKNVDPAHPRSGPYNRDALTDPTRTDYDPVKLAAARKAAEEQVNQIVRYTPEGLQTSAIATGSVTSLTA